MPVVSLRHHPKFENCNVDKKKSRIFPVKELSNVVGCHAEEKKNIVFRKKYEDTKEAIGSRKWPKRKRTQRQIIIYKGQNEKLKIEQ
jgi:hypothetical protein